MQSRECLFCAFVSGSKSCHRIWADERHIAFLSIFPNTTGVTVVIPKQHYPSYVCTAPKETRTGLVEAACAVARLLDGKFEDVARCGVVFEGYGVDHLHAKLYPLHGTNDGAWRPREKTLETYFDTYEGFISTHDGRQANDAELAALAAYLRT